jgi:SAM-dependent methyltransferase
MCIGSRVTLTCEDLPVRDDAERWDARYAGREPGEPRPPAGVDGIELPDRGRCLDIACGLGEQSLWAASLGFDVVSLDVSAVAIEALRAAAHSRGLGDRIDARIVDLDRGLPADVNGDCALVICQRYRDPALYPAIADSAVVGGLIVVTVLSRVGLIGEAGSFHAAPGELLDAFRRLDVEILRSVEGEGEATVVARRTS